ncbi:MAG: hypothetical protein QOI98_1807, partial [Solirubrobacteraceae bacterium]|nr:hypothetical protein [Solirubrobacteraceae bacterium]
MNARIAQVSATRRVTDAGMTQMRRLIVLLVVAAVGL